MAQATAVLIKTNGDVETVILPELDAHVTINDLVGGWFDCVTADNFVMYVHDEGLLIGLDMNPMASFLTGRPIAGDALIVGTLDENGNYDGENYDAPSGFFSEQFAADAKDLVNDYTIKTLKEMAEKIVERGPVIHSW
jgi:hypothetical protein